VIRVVLVDDQPLVRTGLRMILAAEPDLEVVGEASDGHAAITACVEHAPART
jgi:DNA-binding NarL/FixJ family response regulator